MDKISVADIVFVSFPFSNLSNTKLRPALVLAYAQKEDWILCQITSKRYSDNQAIEITDTDYSEGCLDIISYVRPAKLFTANQELIVKKVASLKIEKHQKIVNAIVKILTKGE